MQRHTEQQGKGSYSSFWDLMQYNIEEQWSFAARVSDCFWSNVKVVW